MNYQNKKVLVTGGLGFIGSNLVRKLVEQGADVTIIDSLIAEYGGNIVNIQDVESQVNVNITDVRDTYAMNHLLAGKDYLFNLAGQTSHLDSMDHPMEDLQINAAAQLSILEACRKVNNSIKIVYASTRQVYGKPKYLPVDEQHPLQPVDVNGINKVAGEWYHLLYNNVYGIRACALRLTNTYGPGMRIRDARQTFLGIWIRRLLEGKPILIYGDGSQVRDFNYVDDCVEAMLLAGQNENSNGKVYNLGHHEVLSLLDVAKQMCSIHTPGTYSCIPFPDERKAIDIGNYYGSYALIQKELGWKPKVNLETGLDRSLRYYEQYLNDYI
ncbi:MAG: NAD-dependent epimerase/dehydratase family protein [Bacteroidia bacterium]|jgi:dTDP-glucose 4,6-dehydratase/UDP-glucose 4-epimerase